jgi:Protein of unknown function (DUF3047)
LALVSGFAGGAAADLDESLPASGWREVTFEGKRPNRFAAAPDSITVLSEGTASLIYRNIDADLGMTPCLSWRWRVDEAVPARDLAQKGGDDRSIALWVGFRFDEATASAGDRLSFAARQAMTKDELPGRTLLYVWGGRQAGGMEANPYMPGRSPYRILRPATTPIGRWFAEKVAFVEDHQVAFGRPPTRPVQIAVSSDTDDTGSRSRAAISDVRFVAC